MTRIKFVLGTYQRLPAGAVAPPIDTKGSHAFVLPAIPAHHSSSLPSLQNMKPDVHDTTCNFFVGSEMKQSRKCALVLYFLC